MKSRLIAAAVLAAAVAGLYGCAHKEAPKEETIRAKAAEFDEIVQPRNFRVTDSPYLGAKSVSLSEEDSPILSRHVEMKSRGTLKDVTAALARLVPQMTFNLVDDGAVRIAHPVRTPRGRVLRPDETADPTIEELLAEGLEASPTLADLKGKTLSINYKGPLKGLLHQIGAQSGWGWDYDKATNTVTIASMIMRTFHVNIMPGTMSYNMQLTNKAKQEDIDSPTSKNVKSPVSQELSTSQTTQSASNKMSIDAWKEVLENVRMLLSSKGKATGSKSSGTITVHDHPDNIRKIARYLDKVNGIYVKQVAMKVNVYSLVLSDKNEAGFDIAAVFTGNPAVSLAAGALSTASGSANTASATILKGGFTDSTVVLKALKKWGNATEITSGGLVARNNVPTPLQALRKYTYVAGTASETTDYGQNMAVTPGEVTTGFSLTVVPHIMDGRRVMLNCDVTLAYLEALETFRTGATTIQLPLTSTRAFSQSAVLQHGQTLVLAGYQQAAQNTVNNLGILNASRSADFNKSIIIITIQLENAAPELAGRFGQGV